MIASHYSTTTSTLDARTQQRFAVRPCHACGIPSEVYADDDVTPLCGRCAILALGYSVESIDAAIRSHDER